MNDFIHSNYERSVFMSIRKSQWTNVNGHRVEASSRTFRYDGRHFNREFKPKPGQLENIYDHGKEMIVELHSK